MRISPSNPAVLVVLDRVIYEVIITDAFSLGELHMNLHLAGNLSTDN